MWRSSYGQPFEEVPGLAGNNASGMVQKTTLQTTDVIVPREGGGDSQYSTEGENSVFAFQPELTVLHSQTAAPA